MYYISQWVCVYMTVSSEEVGKKRNTNWMPTQEYQPATLPINPYFLIRCYFLKWQKKKTSKFFSLLLLVLTYVFNFQKMTVKKMIFQCQLLSLKMHEAQRWHADCFISYFLRNHSQIKVIILDPSYKLIIQNILQPFMLEVIFCVEQLGTQNIKE